MYVLPTGSGTSAKEEKELIGSRSDDVDSEDESSDSEESGSSDSGKVTTQLESIWDSPSMALGFCIQYFAIGVISSGVPGTLYGVFLGYLSVPGYVYQTAQTMCFLPWSFKVVFGAINDTVPIRGQHRVPYMVIGWSLCTLTLIKLAITPLPPPYWCVDDDGDYIKEHHLPDGSKHEATPCNVDAASSSGYYLFLMTLTCVGYIVADVAADGLMVQYAKLEPMDQRGTTQTAVYMVRMIGSACSSLFVGLCMNGKLYAGSFSWSLSFNQIMSVFALIAASMVPISYALVREPASRGPTKAADYWKMTWDLLCGKACFFVLAFNVIHTAVGSVSTTAYPLVKEHWAGVQNFQNQMFSLVGSLLFASGLGLYKAYFLNMDWRLLTIVVVVGLNVVDFMFTCCTIFDVVRNQYFFLGETVLIELPAALAWMITLMVMVEMSDDGNEGLMYGFMTTSSNLGYPVAQAVSNQLFRLFKPSLSQPDNYIQDTQEFRMTVFHSCLLSYGFSFLSLVSLFFLPRQKDECQDRKTNWPRHRWYGVVSLSFMSLAFCYSLSVNILSMIPSTMCLEYAGGDGCDIPSNDTSTAP